MEMKKLVLINGSLKFKWTIEVTKCSHGIGCLGNIFVNVTDVQGKHQVSTSQNRGFEYLVDIWSYLSI